MFTTLRRPIASLLIATLAIVACVGEGLHCLPGCGHGVQVGDGVLLLGTCTHGCHHATPPSEHPAADRPHAGDLPMYDEAECAICSAVGQKGTSDDAAEAVMVVPLVHDVPAIVLGDAPVAAAHSFQARAPPVV